jgi:hypothetical protein
MNGWWWNPAEPGRGFFVDYRDSQVCVACCLYAEDGRPSWHSAGPISPGADDVVVGRSRSMRLPHQGEGAGTLPFRLEFTSPSTATLDWGGVRVALEPQHTQWRSGIRDDAMTGWWTEEAASPAHAIVCEQIGRRIFAALLSPDGWTLLEAARGANAIHEGKWWRFEGGQPLGGAHRAPVGHELPHAARVECTQGGALRVRMPDGGERRFVRRPWGAQDSRAPERSARRIEMHFAAHTAGRAASGLVPLSVEIDGGSAFTDSTYLLSIESPGRDAALYEGNLRLKGWTRKLELMLNSHLLPNGTASLVARLSKGGEELARRAIAVSISNTGPLAEKVRESLRDRGGPVVIEGAVDSTHYDMSNRALQPWFEHPGAAEHITQLREAGRITAPEEAALRQFVAEGYMVLPDAIAESLLKEIDDELADAIANKVQGYEYGSSQRIVNLHQRYSGVHALWRHPAVMRHLELVFGVPARPCQTLTYVFGSQQEAHQDTVHLTPFPAGYMCGVWVALEDVRPDSGELEVFPATHRLPRIYMSDALCPKVTDDDWSEFGRKVVTRYRRMLEEGGFGKVTYRPKRGTVLIWHENLLHGGSVRIDMSLSRRSIVSHYFADGAIAFYDSSGRPGHMD